MRNSKDRLPKSPRPGRRGKIWTAVFAALAMVAVTTSTGVGATTLPEDPPELELSWGGFNRSSSILATETIDGERVFVADHWGYRVQVFDSDGVYQYQWPMPSGEPGDIEVGPNRPDGTPTLVVVNHNRHKVHRYTMDGTWLAEFGNSSILHYPSGVAVDAEGNTYVANRHDPRIAVFAPDGSFQGAWGTSAEILGAADVEIGPDGLVYVSDGGADRIQVFETDGTLVGTIGSSGSAPGQLDNPGQLAFDADGDLFVTEYENYRVSKFTTEGNLLTLWTSPPWSGWPYGPTNVDVGPDGAVYVGTHRRNLVQKYIYNEPPTADADGPYLVAIEGQITFDGSGSSDPDLDPLTESWTADGGTVAGETYTAGTETGIFDVCLTVNDGKVDSVTDCTIVVVYDASAGFVTGGGWIDSPAGAYVADPALTGRANFGFVSKYKKGASAPTGNTEFQFRAGDLDFHSDSYDWLVVAGRDRAKFKGVGTINNSGNYGFMLTAVDDETSGDTFRIKIWDRDNADTVVYDNKITSDDDAYDGTVIGGGNIKVHTR